MLDNPQADDTEAETPETPEAEPEAVAPEGEIVIAIDGEEPEPDEDAEIEAELGDKGRHALRALRDATKAARAEARELKAKLAEREAVQPAAQPEVKRPTMEDCGFNEESYADKMAEYLSAKAAADAKKATEAAEAKAREAAYQDKLTRYHAERPKVGVDDDAQAKVVGALTAQQQTALMDASGDPAKVVAALAKTPKVLAELAGIKEIHRFTYRLAQIEGKITVTTKEPPPPESKLRGGVAAEAPINAGSLEKLRQKAEATGDYSAYFRAKAAARGA